MCDWLTANKLTLNIKKTNFVIFCPAQRKLTFQPNITIFDNDKNKYVSLERKEFVKYLGIFIDQNLTWKHHIDHVALKISRYVGLLSKLRHHVPTHTLITIYRSLISPHLTYGLLAWGQACKSHLKKLLKLQKRALRFIYFSDFKQHAVPLFIEAGVLPLKFSFFKITANLMYDVRHKIAPSRIQKQFQDISNIHSHYTRSSASNNFYTQSSRLSIQLNSFSRTGSTIWNGIPLTLRDLRKNDFTRKITSLLFDILISENSYLETCEIIHRIKHFDK